MSKQAIRYVVTGGYFHNGRDRSEHQAIAGARQARGRHDACCTCRGVGIEARGTRAALDAAGAYETEGGDLLLPVDPRDGDPVRAVVVEIEARAS